MTSSKKNVVAKLTIRKNNKLTAKIEIHTNAGHGDFYHWFTKSGRTWSEVRTSNRNDGQRWTHQPRGLEILAARFPADQIKITIGKKRLYKKFLSCPVDQLPGYKPVTLIRTNLTNRRATSSALDILRLIPVPVQTEIES
jgi:hypothetical protein